MEDLQTATELREELNAIVGDAGCYSDLSTDEREHPREIRQQLKGHVRGTACDADEDNDDGNDSIADYFDVDMLEPIVADSDGN